MVDLGFRTLAWGYRKVGIRTILYIGLLMGVMTSIIVGLAEAVTGFEPRQTWLWIFSFLGVSTGWWLCTRGVSIWLGAIISALIGFVVLLVFSGGLLPYLWSTARAVVLILWMHVNENSASQSAISALAISWRELTGAASAILSPVGAWIVSLRFGQPEYNQTALSFIWSMVIWSLAIWCSWGIRRYENTILATLPAGVVLAGSLAYVGGDARVLTLFVGCMLLLLALSAHYLRERRWEALPLPFSEELRFDVSGWSLFITLSLTLAALILPNPSVRNIISWIENRAGRATQSERLIDPVPFGDSLGLLADPTPMPSSMFDAVRTPGLPRKHLIGAGPELGEQVVMVVSVEDLAPGEHDRYYWKSLTYDQYNGQGWETGETREIHYPEGEAVLSELRDQQRVIRQTVSASERLGGLVFASGTLVSVNRDFVVAWREFGDERVDQFGAIQMESRYRADSAVTAFSVSQLKGADGHIPDWIREYYLALPEGLPDRVVQLADQLVENQSSPYDKAVTIERYLRTYPYNLDIEEPPAGRDVVDYFLFELRQGYCDYYATAMVVLARTVGLPARLAVGYASGLYDQANQRYIVTAEDAHSWVEIYFPEVGWIIFEPTAGQPPLEREQTLPDVPRNLERELIPFPSRWERYLRLGGIFLGAMASLLLIGFVAWWKTAVWLLKRRPPQEAITTIYQRIYRFGHRFGITSGFRLTPYEFSDRLNIRLASLVSGSGRGPSGNPWDEPLRTITDIYVESIYGPDVPEHRVQLEAYKIWGSMRVQFWWLWLRSRLTSRAGIKVNSEETFQ